MISRKIWMTEKITILHTVPNYPFQFSWRNFQWFVAATLDIWRTATWLVDRICLVMWYITPADRVTNWMALKVGNVLKMVTGLARGQFAKVKKNVLLKLLSRHLQLNWFSRQEKSFPWNRIFKNYVKLAVMHVNCEWIHWIYFKCEQNYEFSTLCWWMLL